MSPSDLPPDVRRAVGRIGLLPKLLSLLLLVIFGTVGAIGWAASGSPLGFVIMVGCGALLLSLSLRVRARVDGKSFVVRSYLRTYRFEFISMLGFNNAPYSGMWNRSAGTETWLNAGMRMIDAYVEHGPTIPLRATLCGRSTCDVIVNYLNAQLSEVPG